jgi:hypothetical protein
LSKIRNHSSYQKQQTKLGLPGRMALRIRQNASYHAIVVEPPPPLERSSQRPLIRASENCAIVSWSAFSTAS